METKLHEYRDYLISEEINNGLVSEPGHGRIMVIEPRQYTAVSDVISTLDAAKAFVDGLHAATAAIGTRGGSSTSPAKQAAVRENGKLGGRPKGKISEHKTGYYVWLYGEKFWHRSLDAAIRQVEKQTYCSIPQIIEIGTGELVYGSPQ